MAKLKASSVEARALIQNLEGNEIGSEFELPSMFPGLPGKTVARLTGRSDKWWSLQLIALGVEFATVTASIEQGDLVLEEVKNA